MFVELIVRMFGGIWKLKDLCNRTQNKFVRKYLIKLYRLYQNNNGASIAWNSNVAGVPCMPHGLHGVFIAATSSIGKNCVIFHHVTIGANTLVDSNGVGAPTVGDNCYIGAGAKIVGKVTIGSNVRIGANCVVYKDVPDNSIVVSAEQKTISREEKLCNKFHIFKEGKWFFYDDGSWIEEEDVSSIDKLDFCKKAFNS
jgi:serine O-acetyltransferase